MDIINIVKEEYDNMILTLYHVTSKDNLESIIDNGFRIGTRKMQGKGFYSFYDYRNSIRYAMKDNPYNTTIVKFTYPISNIDIILNMEIAEKVYGSGNYSLIDQINRQNWDGIKGIEGFIKGVRSAYKRNITEDELIVILKEIEDDNSEMSQRKFWGELIPYEWNNNLNIILDGYYGIECRINKISNTKVIGYYDYDQKEFEFKYNSINI